MCIYIYTYWYQTSSDPLCLADPQKTPQANTAGIVEEYEASQLRLLAARKLWFFISMKDHPSVVDQPTFNGKHPPLMAIYG